ncbi:MAG: hypothetical protein Q7R33_04250 [Nitrosarchaeum sp.]|nr:hypothetical protein [Nitrosarchaeum sp.]
MKHCAYKSQVSVTRTKMVPKSKKSLYTKEARQQLKDYLWLVKNEITFIAEKDKIVTEKIIDNAINSWEKSLNTVPAKKRLAVKFNKTLRQRLNARISSFGITND